MRKSGSEKKKYIINVPKCTLMDQYTYFNPLRILFTLYTEKGDEWTSNSK